MELNGLRWRAFKLKKKKIKFAVLGCGNMAAALVTRFCNDFEKLGHFYFHSNK